MTNDKLAATFHGEDTCDHGDYPRGLCLSCGKVWDQEAPDPTPEQALRAHVADRRQVAVALLAAFVGGKGDVYDLADHLLAAGVFRDDAAVKAEALTEAAEVHRGLARAAKTRDGRYEHMGLADWLDEHADAVKAGQATDPTKAAIETVARSVTEQILGDAGQEIGDLWSDYPEIGESDWQAVVWLVMWRARNGKPDEAAHREAYEHLKGRATAAQDGAA